MSHGLEDWDLSRRELVLWKLRTSTVEHRVNYFGLFKKIKMGSDISSSNKNLFTHTVR